MGVGEDFFFLMGVGGGALSSHVFVWGEEGGQLRSQVELTVNSLFIVIVCVFYSPGFSHLVFYF